MNLSTAISLYLVYKRSLGHRFRTEDNLLKAFCRAVGDLPMIDIEAAAVLAFLNGNGPVTEYWGKKHNALSGFYRFAMTRGIVSRSPLPYQVPLRTGPAFVPYIYSEDEIRNLPDACPAACPGKCHIEDYVLRALLALLYGAALRLGEALSLTTADVDLGQAVLRVRETKFFKSRFVPLGRDLTREMTRYLAERNGGQLVIDDRPFFCCRNGQAVPKHMAADTAMHFQRLVGAQSPASARRNQNAMSSADVSAAWTASSWASLTPSIAMQHWMPARR